MTRRAAYLSAGRSAGIVLAALLLIVSPLAALGDAAPRFRPVEVWLDAHGEQLAAYQVEIKAGDQTTIVGVEGGNSRAFAAPPHYDPAALRGGRIILADFSTADDVPRGRTRIATLHMRETGSTDTTYRATVTAAAAPDGRHIPVTIEIVPQSGDPS